MNLDSTGGEAVLDSGRSQPYKTAIALCLVGIAVYVWWPHRIAVRAPVRAQPFISSQFNANTEAAWMTQQIGRDVLETVAYAITHKHPGTISLQFQSGSSYDGKNHRLTGKFNGIAEVQVPITVERYFWAPETFAPWATALLTAAHWRAPKEFPRADLEYFSRLTNPTPETLTREDKRLSDALTTEPLNPELHEQAALLIGSFAMRQSAGAAFGDLRRPLSKMTAHLALAKSIRGKLGPSGDLAEAVLCSLTGRETPALEIVDRLQGNAGIGQGVPATAPAIWSKALRMHNTGDYRLFGQPENASLLERLEYFRALRYSVDSAAATRFVLDHELEPLAEWTEIILAGHLSVADGNRWAEGALKMELAEYAAQYRNYFGKPIAREEAINALNAGWEQFPKSNQEHPALNVLGWGAWAEQHQRQLCDLIETTSYWLGRLQGMPKSAADFEDQFTREFHALNLFPLIRFYTSQDDSSTRSFNGRVRTIAAEHPQWVTFEHWQCARSEMMRIDKPFSNAPGSTAPRRSAKQRPTPRPTSVPKIDPLFTSDHWFFPPMPVGTLYDLSNRSGRSGMSGVNAVDIEAAKAMAPSNVTILQQHLLKTTNFKPTPDQTEAQFDRVSGYNVRAMKLVSSAVIADPVRYARVYGALCWFDPDRYVDLGKYFVQHGDEEKAVQAYQNAFDHATDRVHVSNTMGWLVNYYYDHGKTDDAMRIASDAADAYSQVGLVTMADLYDRMGRLDLAEWYLKKAQARYPESTEEDLLDFYARNRDKSPAYAAAEKEFRSHAFPNGADNVTLGDLHDPPEDGIIFNGTSERTTKAELQKGDIFVGLNGYRIHNVAQYHAARHPYNNPNVTFILWRGGKYLELKTIFPWQPDDTPRIDSYSAHPEQKR